MRSDHGFKATLASAWTTFFKKDLALDSRGTRPRLVLVDRGEAAQVKAGRVDEAASRAAADLALMREQLRALLDHEPGTRQVVRHLAFFEHALARNGMRALQTMPPVALQRALDEFENLVINWSPVGLATLRSKMAVALVEREPDRGDPLPEPELSTLSAEPGDCTDDAATDAALAQIYGAMGIAEAKTPA
jgi:hypothetical protein